MPFFKTKFYAHAPIFYLFCYLLFYHFCLFNMLVVQFEYYVSLIQRLLMFLVHDKLKVLCYFLKKPFSIWVVFALIQEFLFGVFLFVRFCCLLSLYSNDYRKDINWIFILTIHGSFGLQHLTLNSWFRKFQVLYSNSLFAAEWKSKPFFIIFCKNFCFLAINCICQFLSFCLLKVSVVLIIFMMILEQLKKMRMMLLLNHYQI